MDNIKDFEINSPRWLSNEDFDGEIWKDITGFEGIYKVSNYGRVKRLKANTLRQGINYSHMEDHILKAITSNNRNVYWRVKLHYNGKKEDHRIHRLVAIAFIPNPMNLPEINHKDENKLNPKSDNLEWCDRKYNSSYGTMPERARKNFRRDIVCRKVYQYDTDGNFIASYESQRTASRITGISKNTICEVCREKKNYVTAGGFIWSFTKKKSDIARKVERAKRACRKAITQRNIDGYFIKSFKSIREASLFTGISSASISQCLSGKTQKAGGYKWEYNKQFK